MPPLFPLPLPSRPLRRGVIALLLVAGVLAALLAACGGDDAPDGAVHLLTIDDEINPVVADFIDRAIDRAEDHRATLVVIQLDTPGGLVSATDDIVQRIESARVPVAVFVSPLGARAASAGAFITLAAHVAAMAPSTQIGAAHPIAGGGEDIEGELGEKVTNDAAADIRAIAQLRGRNADWAERAVRESISATATEALDLNVIDLIATDLADLLAQIDGRSVTLLPDQPPVILRTAGAPLVKTEMSIFEQFLNLISDPNIAFLLLSLGGLALFIEIIVPGHFGPGIFGVIALIVAFFSLGTLDTNPAGIALVVLAFVLFLVEAFNPGLGIFGAGGLVSLILGGILLISDTPDAEQVSLWVLGTGGAIIAAAILALWFLILQARRRPPVPVVVADRIVGKVGIVRSALVPYGTVLAGAELWSARSDGGAIAAGTPVQVVARRRAHADRAPPGGAPGPGLGGQRLRPPQADLARVKRHPRPVRQPHHQGAVAAHLFRDALIAPTVAGGHDHRSAQRLQPRPPAGEERLALRALVGALKGVQHRRQQRLPRQRPAALQGEAGGGLIDRRAVGRRVEVDVEPHAHQGKERFARLPLRFD